MMKIFLPLSAVLLCISMLIFPKETYEAASMGLMTWWTIVFPSLLPFYIVAELFLGLGVVHFISVLLEPVMRPIFKLPGCAAFVVALGYTSGFPIGASLTASLRQQRLCTRLEGERLVAFTNNASPLFIFVAVSVGIFHRPSLGIMLAAAHYLANLTLGFLLRFYGRKDPEQKKEKLPWRGLMMKSFAAMFEAQKKDGRPLGKLLSDAVRKSVQSLAIIGGFIIVFAVLIKIMTLLGMIAVIETALGLLFYPFHFSPPVLKALSHGLFEMTLGVKMAGESLSPFPQQIIAASIIMGWSGLSIHAQVASIISETDLRFFPFFITRIFHMALSGIIAFFLIQSQTVTTASLLPTALVLDSWLYILIPFCFSLILLLFPLCITAICFFLIKTTWLILRIKR